MFLLLIRSIQGKKSILPFKSKNPVIKLLVSRDLSSYSGKYSELVNRKTDTDNTYNQKNSPNKFKKLNKLNILGRKRLTEHFSQTKMSEGYTKIIEGSAEMHYSTEESVFYNKVQVFNRDLSIHVLNLFSDVYLEEHIVNYQKRFDSYQKRLIEKEAGKEVKGSEPILPVQKKGIVILDALAASGLRSIRYLNEINNVERVVINDLSVKANEQAKDNCQRNNVDMSKVDIQNQDANSLMYNTKFPNQYDVIDLDPYGTVSPFLDAAMQAITNGGLLCVTSTDAPALNGNYTEVSYSRYNSYSVRSQPYHHEMSLRILLHSLDVAANRYGKYIVPWISLSIDFYVRVFVRVYDSSVETKNSCLKNSLYFQALDNPSFYLQNFAKLNDRNTYTTEILRIPSVCKYTGSPLKIGGPIYNAPLHNQEIVDKLLERAQKALSEKNKKNEKSTNYFSTLDRMIGTLELVSEEVKDVIYFYYVDHFFSAVQYNCPPVSEIKSILYNAGYRVSSQHREPRAIKTDAPLDFVSRLSLFFHLLLFMLLFLSFGMLLNLLLNVIHLQKNQREVGLKFVKRY